MTLAARAGARTVVSRGDGHGSGTVGVRGERRNLPAARCVVVARRGILFTYFRGERWGARA
ncbi:hypothetical protein ARHIZOSPH14_12580 [Agromyces rhizosphaerae]|uniref:Uncharacterized protein n=1 Tax=Agromyces rhizosphaerae TaxID=88374 RepID=A0A9W6FNZ3_9MICO|nr:hypothetical protein ARHIZOSPH14_12580 [Agromyces rhizosphaerae]